MITDKNKHFIFMKKMSVYKDSKYNNIPVCEQIAILFDLIAKDVERSEDLYAQNKIQEAYTIVDNNIALCGKLCEILTAMLAANAKGESGEEWITYFSSLMRGIVLLSSNHNVERKQKLVKSIKEMGELWRNKGKEYAVTTHNAVHTKAEKSETINSSLNLDI